MDFPTDTIKKYVQSLEKKSIAKNELKRRLLSVDKFLRWAHEKGYLTSVVFKQMESEIASKTGVGVKSEESKKPSARQSFTFESLGIRHYIGFALVLLLISMIGAGLYNQFFRKTATPFAYSSSPLPGTRLISFQGRLTDSIGNPITAPIDITYNFYQNPTGGTPIATSTRVCTAHPDQDGIFSNMIGNDEGPNCSSQLPSSIFTDNATVYLGVTIGSELTEMSPRQQIANVGYAMNAEALQGMPPGTTASSIPFISAAGDMLIAAANPGIRSTYASSNFVISSANATTIQSANGGDIVLSATDGGTLRFNTYNGTLNERMTITPLGNVGISNANPRASLDVIGDASLSGNLAFNGATTQLTQLNGGNMTFATSPGGDVGAAARMTLSSLGNLGIGTTVPGYRLDVAGSASVSGNLSMGGQLQIGRFAANPAAVGTGSIYFNTTDSTLYVYNSTTWVPVGTGTGTGGSFWDRVLDGVLISKVPADALNLGNQATASATVHLAGAAGDNSFINTGNFGIGTNNPTQKLEVAGNIYSSTGLGIGEVNSGDMFHIKKQDVFNAVYVNSNGAWSNNTTEAASSYGTAFTLQQHHQSYPTTDYGYVGKSTTYSTIYIDISTASSAVTYAYEYSKGSGVWGVLTLTTDGTNDGSGSMRKDGTIVFTPPGDWATDTVNGTTGYWVRWYSTVNPSTHPTAYLVVPSDQEAMRIYANDTDAASTLRVSRNGNVSIGTDTSDSYRLYVSGNGYFSSALSTGSTLSTSSYITQSRNSLGMISNDGISLNNTTAATAVAPVQIAPRLRMSGTVWDAAASASRTVNWKEEVQAISGATGKSRMDWAYGYNSVTDTGFDNLMSLTSDGELNVFGTTFGSETLTNGNLTAGASWSSANGVTLSSDRANYAHNALGGTLTQTSASLATAAQPNRWYKLTYTTSSVVAGVNAYVGTEFADQKTYLPGIPATAGTYDVIFKSNAAPGDFVIHFESTAGSVILDTLSLVEIQSGNIVANGLLTGGGTSGIKILSDGNVGIGSTSPSSFKLEVAGDIGPDADNTRNIGSATRFYNTIYANNIVGVSALSYWVRNTGILSPGMPNDGIAATSSATTVATFTSTGTNNAAQIGGTSNYLTVASNGSLTFTNSSAATITGPAAGLTIDAGTGTMGFGTSNNARTINMGTGTGVDTINIGTGATGADVIAIGSANAGNVTVQSNAVLSLTGSTNSLIDFPNFDVATTGNVTVAAGQGIDTNAAGILNVGNTTATTVNVGNTAAATIAIGAGGSLTRTFNIGTGTGVDTINLGTGGTGADVINIGSANAGNVTMRSNATLTLAGSTNSLIDFPNFDVATTGNVTVAAGQGIDTNAAGILNVGNTTATTVNVGNTAATTIALGAGGSLTRTFNIGTGTGVDTINIGTGATGADVIAIGSANAGNVTVRSNATLTLAGSTNSIIDFPNFDVATTGQITSVYANAAALNLTGNASGITFGGAAGNMNTINTSNNNNLNIEPGSGNVGISSTTPTSFKLEVAGDIGPDADGTRSLGSPSRHYNNLYVNNIFGSGSLGYWTRNAGVLSPSTGNDAVAATSSATTVATFTSSGTNTSLRAGGSANYLAVASNGSLTFTNSSTATITGPTAGLTIDATTGTLGFGTSNNNRTVNIGTGTGIDTIHIGDGATGADIITIGSANAGNVTVRSNAALSLIGSTNSIIDYPAFDVATTGQTTIAYANAAALNLSGNGAGITFSGAAANTNTINTSNNNHLNLLTGTGNVGIGSATPGTKLDVVGAIRTNNQLISTIATGTAPLSVASTTMVSNLNSDMVDGFHGTDLAKRAGYSATLTAPAGWYRIASNGPVTVGGSGGSRAVAMFTVRDTTSGRHSNTTFYASVNYGNNPTLTMLNRSFYTSNGCIKKARLIEGSTYEGAAVEIYVENGGLDCSVSYTMYDNEQSSGWTAENWTAGSLPVGFTETDMNFDTTNPILAASSNGNADAFYVGRTGNMHLSGALDIAGSIANAAGNVVIADTADIGSATTGLRIDATGLIADIDGNIRMNDILEVNTIRDYSGGNITLQDDAGNVGIGSTSPSEKLDVTGDVYIAGSGTSIGRATLANGSLKIGSTLAIDSNELYYGINSYIGTIGAFSLSLDTNATTRIALDATGNINFNNGQMYLAQSSGNLGLGTTVPGYRLDVQGWASASGNLTTGGQFQLGRFASAPAPTLGSGSMYFNSTDNSVYYYDGTIWNQIAAGGTSFWTRDSGVLSPLNEGDVIAATSGAHTVATFTQLDPTKLALRAGGSTDLTGLFVFGDGSISIGTPSAKSRLTIAGGITGTQEDLTSYIESGRNVTPWDQTFEENITSWYTINNTSLTQSSTQAHEGANSFRIKRNDLTGSGGAAYTLGTGLLPGRVYTLSGYYKMVNGSGTAGIKLTSNATNAYTNGSTHTDKVLTNASNWTFFSISITASTIVPTNNNYVWIGSNMPDATQEIYFDNLVLSEGSLPQTEYANMKTTTDGLATYFGGNVGIGTSAPLEKLDIAGNATISGNLTMGYGSTIRPAYGSLNFDYKSGLNAWTTGMVMQSSNGNVGIGTTAPVQKLQIAGNMAFDAVDRHIYRGTSARLSLLSSSTVFNESSGNIDLRVEGDTDQYLLFADASVDRIGIGTSTPGSKFDVRSTQTSGTLGSFGAPSAVTLAGALTGVNIDMSTNYTVANQGVTGQTINMPTVVNTLGGTYTYKGLSIAGGNLTHNTTAGIDNWSGVDIVMPNLTQTVGAITSTGLKITGGTVTSGTSYGLTIDDAAGNVGIGTTAPTSKLQIASTLPLTGSANGLALGVTDTETGALTTVARGALLTNYTKNGAGSISSWLTYAANFNGTISGGSSTSHYGIWSRQTVNGTGSIGTLSDFVADAQYGTAGSVTTRYGLDVKDFNKGGTQTLGTQYGVYVESLTSGSTNYAFYSAGTTPSYFGGNIGIGTTAPLDTLDVRGSATLSGSLTVGSNSLIKPAYGPLSLAYKSGLDTWATGITLQDTTGAVGIGTTIPSTLLDVEGAMGGNAAVIFNQLSGGPIFTASSSGTPRFTIANNGNVGIGVGYANPTNPLQVLSTSTPQLRLSYSTSEYSTVGVSSNGTTTLTSPNGASNKLSFVSGINSGGLTNEAITLKSNQTLNSDDEIIQVLGNTTPYFTVLGSGLTWIGNTNPSTAGLTANDKLYIDGDFRAAKFLSNTNSNRYVDPANGSRMSTIEITDGSSIQFNDASNVGIGTIKMEGSSVRIGNNVADGISDVDLCVGSDSSCAGKVDAGTVDPPYTINGKKYATYMASMTGVKEETTGVLLPEQAQKTGDAYAYVIDFDNQAEASDLWLFAKATNVKDRMSRLNVLLTPSENTRTWYKTDADHHALIVYSSRPSSISYRLTAPRFDDTIFSNTRPDDAAGGFVINDPDVMTSPYTLTDSGSILEAMNIETPASQDSSPDMLRSLSYSLRNIQTGSLIEETAVYANAMFARIQTGFAESANLLVTNIANIKTAVVTNLTATTARIDDALISRLYVQEKIVSPVIETEKIKTDTIAPAGTNLTLDLSAHIATSSGDFAKLVIKGINDNTVVSIDAQGNATFAGSLAAKEASISGSLTASEATISGTLIAKEIHADNIDELANTNLQLSSNLASQSSSLAQLNSSSQQLSSDVNSVQQELAALKNQPLPNAQYYQTLSNSAAATVSALLAQSVSTDSLMVTGTANLFKASVADSLTAGNILIQDNAILSLASDLRLSALAQVTFFDGTVMIAKNGTITSKGEVIAEGGIKTNTIQAVTDDANIAVNLNADKKLQVTSEGQEVASIDASGSAKFNSLAFNEIATNSAFIADSGERTSANEIIPAIQTNAEAAGTGVLPSNAPEIIIYNSKVTNDSLIYLTPTGETHGAQLTVVKKESCSSAQPLTPCTPYFSVSTGTGLHTEIKFNWLIIN